MRQKIRWILAVAYNLDVLVREGKGGEFFVAFRTFIPYQNL